ncbi:hypothetical protein GCM10009616_34120 [Microlunatus lacustris]
MVDLDLIGSAFGEVHLVAGVGVDQVALDDDAAVRAGPHVHLLELRLQDPVPGRTPVMTAGNVYVVTPSRAEDAGVVLPARPVISRRRHPDRLDLQPIQLG